MSALNGWGLKRIRGAVPCQLQNPSTRAEALEKQLNLAQ